MTIFLILQSLCGVIDDYLPEWFPLTWFNEFMMLEAFGFAYLVKSEAIARLND